MSGLPSPVTSAIAGALKNASPWISWVYCDRFAPVTGSVTDSADRSRVPIPGAD
jgi:hypothetical protein